MSSKESIQHVSDTAFWVASYRAAETGRPDALFRDPLANALLGERGQRLSQSMKSTARYASWNLIMRTKLIDDYIQKYISHGCKTIINLGAGLDTRPYRLELPQDVLWIEIDFPHVIQMKEDKLKDHKPNCQLKRIQLDLSNDEIRKKLFQELNRHVGTALVLTEGVIPYLSENIVQELAHDLQSCSQFRYWIIEYYDPKLYPRFQAKSFKKLLRGAPFEFFPQNWFGFFEKCGWIKKEMTYLFDVGEENHRPFPIPFWLRPIRWIAPKEKWAEKLRLQGYAVMEKSGNFE